MKYVIRLVKTITLTEYVEVSDEHASNVIEAMNLAEEEAAKIFVREDEWCSPRTESKWAVASVQTKEEQ